MSSIESPGRGRGEPLVARAAIGRAGTAVASSASPATVIQVFGKDRRAGGRRAGGRRNGGATAPHDLGRR